MTGELEASDNPFTPGFSQAPGHLAGRDDVLAAAEDGLRVILAGRTPPPLLLVGARGVGKTVLLAEIADQAGNQLGWPRVRSEAGPRRSLLEEITREAIAATQSVTEAPRSRFRTTDATLRAGVFGMGAELHLQRNTTGDAQAGSVYSALRDLASAAAERDAGFVLTVDEIQTSKLGELHDLAAALQRGTEERWPILMVGAGLATMRDPRRSVTYFERGRWRQVDVLARSDSLAALTVPALRAGRPFSPEAAGHIVDATGGYPYALQLYGYHAWAAAAGASRIEVEHALRGAAQAQGELETGLYAARWALASSQERRYLLAVAQLVESERVPTTGTVANQLGQPSRAVASYRERLLVKGTLFLDGEALRFAVPGMASWVLRRSTQDLGGSRGGGGQWGTFVMDAADHHRALQHLETIQTPKPIIQP